MTTTYQNKLVDNSVIFTCFSELKHLHSSLQENLKKLEFSLMTPIQRYSIYHINEGYDLMGCADTGSGKTIAFLLPIVNKMLKEGPPNDSGIIILMIY